MKYSLNHTHLQRLLFSIVFSAFGLTVFAQSFTIKKSEASKEDTKVEIITRSCGGNTYVINMPSNDIAALDQQLSNLQNYKSQARSLKRKIRSKRRTLKRKEARLVNKIQGVEDYIRVDDRLTKEQISNYYKEIRALSQQLMQVRADRKKLNRMYRRAKRLLRGNSYSYSYRSSCGNDYYYSRHRRYRHHHRGANPWWTAFVTLFSINLLIGSVIAYRTLRKS